MNRSIVHLDLDTFFVSVERLRNSKLNKLPILIGGSSDRGVVASCSYEARRFGVHSAMSMRMATRLCPEAIIVRPDFDIYSRYSQQVTEIIAERSPVVEKASIDEHYLDITGMDRYFGCLKWTHELRSRIINETGLPISLGLSENKTVSKIATGQAKPNGERSVINGTEKQFLAPLPIRRIPMLGEKTAAILNKKGIIKISTLQLFPVEPLQELLGINGVSIWKKARGIDNSPVVPYAEQKSMSKERTYDKDTMDVNLLHQTLLTMVDELAFELRQAGRLTGCVTIKIRYSNWETATMQSRVSYTASDRVLSQKAEDLFRKLFTRRMMLRLVGIKFSDLICGTYQIDLFNDAITDINLAKAMDSIRNQFGVHAVLKATCL